RRSSQFDLEYLGLGDGSVSFTSECLTVTVGDERLGRRRWGTPATGSAAVACPTAPVFRRRGQRFAWSIPPQGGGAGCGDVRVARPAAARVVPKWSQAPMRVPGMPTGPAAMPRAQWSRAARAQCYG